MLRWNVMDNIDKAVWFDFPSQSHSSISICEPHSCSIFNFIWIFKLLSMWKIISLSEKTNYANGLSPSCVFGFPCGKAMSDFMIEDTSETADFFMHMQILLSPLLLLLVIKIPQMISKLDHQNNLNIFSSQLARGLFWFYLPSILRFLSRIEVAPLKWVH